VVQTLARGLVAERQYYEALYRRESVMLKMAEMNDSKMC
jgi:hypothetical protein